MGQRVKSGDALAVMGSTGNAALASPPFAHCHFAVRATDVYKSQILACVLPGVAGRLTVIQNGESWYIDGAQKRTPEFSDGSVVPVSYTHLDVYKRQAPSFST